MSVKQKSYQIIKQKHFYWFPLSAGEQQPLSHFLKIEPTYSVVFASLVFLAVSQVIICGPHGSGQPMVWSSDIAVDKCALRRFLPLN